MKTEVSDFISGDHCVHSSTSSLLLLLLLVALGEHTEASNFNLAGRHGSLRVNHDGDEWLLMLLIKGLCANVDTWKPAAIAWVRVVPSAHILWAMHVLAEFHVRTEVLVGLVTSVHASLRTFNREPERVHHIESIYNSGWVSWAKEDIFLKDNQSEITKNEHLPPLTLPCISPITSMSPPRFACITILISAVAEIFTLLK